MRITAKQIDTLSTLCPVEEGAFNLGITQAKGKTTLRVQDGQLSYKIKADGTVTTKPPKAAKLPKTPAVAKLDPVTP